VVVEKPWKEGKRPSAKAIQGNGEKNGLKQKGGVATAGAQPARDPKRALGGKDERDEETKKWKGFR